MPIEDPASVNSLLDRIEEQRNGGKVSLATVQQVAGQRMSGPMLLAPGLILVSPLSGIPTLPTILAIVIFLVSIQLVMGRRSIWIPSKLRNAGLSPDRTGKAISYLRPVARMIDRISQQRISWMTSTIPVRIASLLCVAIAVMMPVTELIPFSSSLAGLVIAVFGLAIMTGDGLLIAAVFLMVLTGAAVGLQLAV